MKKLDYGVVTCEYCDNYIRNDFSQTNNIFECGWGWCKKQDKKKWCQAEICEDFVIIPGYHTPKWYPNKKSD